MLTEENSCGHNLSAELFGHTQRVSYLCKFDSTMITNSFPIVLLRLIEQDQSPHGIGWGPQGNIWIKPSVFERDCMKVHFPGMNKYASFARKMNRYGFMREVNKSACPSDVFQYSHEIFRKGITLEIASSIRISRNRSTRKVEEGQNKSKVAMNRDSPHGGLSCKVYPIPTLLDHVPLASFLVAQRTQNNSNPYPCLTVHPHEMSIIDLAAKLLHRSIVWNRQIDLNSLSGGDARNYIARPIPQATMCGAVRVPGMPPTTQFCLQNFGINGKGDMWELPALERKSAPLTTFFSV